MKKKEKEKGITLVALIITVIILLILAVVAISAITGDGILAHAKNVRDEYARAQEKEASLLDQYMSYLNGGGSLETVEDAVGTMDSNHTITLYSSLPTDTYTLKYEDTNGVMTTYADICSLESGASYDDFIAENTAPQTATKIGVYSSSGDRVGSVGFTPTFKPNLGNKLYSFGALADTHIGGDTTYDSNFSNALTYLNKTENVSFICIPGDLTNACSDEQFALYKNMVATYSPNTPVYESTGNHDTPFWRTGEYTDEEITEYTALKDMIESATSNPLYYSFTQGNDVFIMLGVQTNREGALFTQNELQWLYETLENNRNKRCFVFEHVLPENGSGNVNGWYENDSWGGTEQMVLESLFEHYPNVTLFHGHTHQQFEKQSESDTATYINQFGCHSVHIPSISATKGLTSADFGKSQGYVADVYENGIVLRGRDFKGEKFLPIAQYYLDTTLKTVIANTYVDDTATINCKKANIEWAFETHVDKSTGKVATREEYASTNLISIKNGKTTYFHTSYKSPYGLDICCYDESGDYLGYFNISLSNDNRYTAPIELNSLVKDGTSSIRLRMYTGTDYTKKTSPIFITVK